MQAVKLPLAIDEQRVSRKRRDVARQVEVGGGGGYSICARISLE
jgi:hypothetical protein